jgi:RNA polymerase sigma-70 factor, ECF subfamily
VAKRKNGTDSVTKSSAKLSKEDQFLALATPDTQKRLLHIAQKYSQRHCEDLVQDAMLTAWKNFDKFKGGSFIAWVAQIIRYTYFNIHRVSKLAKFRDLGDFDREAPEQSQGPSEELQKALNKLHPKQQEIIWMTDWYGLSYLEAADAAGIPLGTVMSRLHRARGNLKRELQAQAS